jgi:hypothetical protein
MMARQPKFMKRKLTITMTVGQWIEISTICTRSDIYQSLTRWENYSLLKLQDQLWEVPELKGLLMGKVSDAMQEIPNFKHGKEGSI